MVTNDSRACSGTFAVTRVLTNPNPLELIDAPMRLIIPDFRSLSIRANVSSSEIPILCPRIR